MSAPASRFRASVGVIAGVLVAELVVYLGVLLAYSSAGEQPAQQVSCCWHAAAGAAPRGLYSASPVCHPSTADRSAAVLSNSQGKDRMICQTPNDDPCSRVTSSAEAVEYAEALLKTAAARPGCEFWAAAAVGPVAAMLYAASPHKGAGWLAAVAADNTRDALGDAGLGWQWAIPYLADQPLLGNALERVLDLQPRQRDSLVMTMRDALSSWIRAERHDERE
ncbi:hypothetical protein [Mycobacterium arosiense]|uniref:hypothetical protein n=1 Tax=Mycobacterium arosiense TaxID=425468 RepID=UPI0011510627|nr:hypothetical protein [Mycobacterium arosiense]